MREIDQLCDEMQCEFETIKRRASESIVQAKKEAYGEVLAGLVALEVDVETGFTEENIRKFARVYAIVGELKDDLEKYRGTVDIPLEDLERLGKGRLPADEVRALWMAVRYTEALKTLEKLKPGLARALMSARSAEEKTHPLPF